MCHKLFPFIFLRIGVYLSFATKIATSIVQSLSVIRCFASLPSACEFSCENGWAYIIGFDIFVVCRLLGMSKIQ